MCFSENAKFHRSSQVAQQKRRKVSMHFPCKRLGNLPATHTHARTHMRSLTHTHARALPTCQLPTAVFTRGERAKAHAPRSLTEPGRAREKGWELGCSRGLVNSGPQLSLDRERGLSRGPVRAAWRSAASRTGPAEPRSTARRTRRLRVAPRLHAAPATRTGYGGRVHLTVQNASHAARHGAAVLRIMLHQQYAQRRHAAIS